MYPAGGPGWRVLTCIYIYIYILLEVPVARVRISLWVCVYFFRFVFMFSEINSDRPFAPQSRVLSLLVVCIINIGEKSYEIISSKRESVKTIYYFTSFFLFFLFSFLHIVKKQLENNNNNIYINTYYAYRPR